MAAHLQGPTCCLPALSAFSDAPACFCFPLRFLRVMFPCGCALLPITPLLPSLRAHALQSATFVAFFVHMEPNTLPSRTRVHASTIQAQMCKSGLSQLVKARAAGACITAGPLPWLPPAPSVGCSRVECGTGAPLSLQMTAGFLRYRRPAGAAAEQASRCRHRRGTWLALPHPAAAAAAYRAGRQHCNCCCCSCRRCAAVEVGGAAPWWLPDGRGHRQVEPALPLQPPSLLHCWCCPGWKRSRDEPPSPQSCQPHAPQSRRQKASLSSCPRCYRRRWAPRCCRS